MTNDFPTLVFKTERNSPNAGFTLTELLLAASLTMVVVGAAGFGVVAILTDYNSKDTKLTQQSELRRATDFIAEEVKQAINIEQDAAIAFNEAKNNAALRFNPSSNAKPVLSLDIPGVDDEVLYYITSPSSSSPWLGPQVIYRFGPNFTRNGVYSNPTTPNRWTVEPLVDGMDKTAVSVSCPNGGTPNPSNGVKGFYACVSPTSKMVQIYLNSTDQESGEEYSSTTQVFVRADDAPALADPPTSFTSSAIPFNLSGGTLILNTAADVTIQVLGSNTQCSINQTTIPVTTQLILDSQLAEQTLNSGDSLILSSGTANTLALSATATATLEREGCESNFTTDSTDSVQVYTLLNGDSISHIAALSDTNTIASFLQNYIVNGTVNLQANQILYLFEMEATSTTDSAYDLQDNAVLVTVD